MGVTLRNKTLKTKLNSTTRETSGGSRMRTHCDLNQRCVQSMTLTTSVAMLAETNAEPSTSSPDADPSSSEKVRTIDSELEKALSEKVRTIDSELEKVLSEKNAEPSTQDPKPSSFQPRRLAEADFDVVIVDGVRYKKGTEPPPKDIVDVKEEKEVVEETSYFWQFVLLVILILALVYIQYKERKKKE